MKILLASQSPRRQQLLSLLGLPLQVVAIHVDETLDQPIATSKVAEHLACRKAEGYPRELIGEEQMLVTADTIVALGDTVMGKPKDAAEASQMLHALSGKRHTVYTGVCLTTRTQRRAFTEATHVYFRQLSHQEIAHYIDTYQPYDKAGAYGIQEWIGMIGIEKIDGCYYNVMGLPIARLYKEMTALL